MEIIFRAEIKTEREERPRSTREEVQWRRHVVNMKEP
jgi:hypothetical protein